VSWRLQKTLKASTETALIPMISTVSEPRSQSSQRPFWMYMTPPLANRPLVLAQSDRRRWLSTHLSHWQVNWFKPPHNRRSGTCVPPESRVFMLLELTRGEGANMKKMLAVTVLATALTPVGALAQERAGDAALGALSGAVVLGPVGAVAGAVVGYTAGPAIASSWGLRRYGRRHYRRSARR
jgi:hypothetical protein